MQRRATIPVLSLAIIILTSWNVAAQGGPGGRGGGHQPPKPAIDTVLDTNGDEVIGSDEIENAASALIELDTDNDGALSFEECMGFSNDGDRQGPPSGRGGSGRTPPAPPIFSALDTSGDEIVSEHEIADAPESLNELDANGDGALQADETRPSQPGGGRGGGQPQNR